MTADQIITIVSAMAGSGVIVAVLNYFQSRRKLSAEGDIAQGSAKAQIGIVSMQELEAKLGYLQKIIALLENRNIKLEEDANQGYALNTQLQSRVRELARKCDQLEAVVRRLCVENNLDPNLYLGGE